MSTSPLTALCRCAHTTGIEARLQNKKEARKRKGVNTKMELNIQSPKPNGNGNGHLDTTRKSQSTKTSSSREVHHSIFDPMKYMLKLPKTKKVSLPNGQVRFEKTEADYLPVAARIA